MFGLVNQAIVSYVTRHHGDAALEALRSKTEGVDLNFFSMEQYPDEWSVALVKTAAEIVGERPEILLEKIGEFWIEFVLEGDYADMISIGGGSVAEFLMNLDALHARVGQAFHDLRPPSFWCTDVTSDSLLLHYSSERDGLAPLAVGMIKGVGRMFDVEVSVTSVGSESGDDESHTFRVDMEPCVEDAASAANRFIEGA